MANIHSFSLPHKNWLHWNEGTWHCLLQKFIRLDACLFKNRPQSTFGHIAWVIGNVV
jgi:hypothetical protein